MDKAVKPVSRETVSESTSSTQSSTESTSTESNSELMCRLPETGDGGTCEMEPIDVFKAAVGTGDLVGALGILGELTPEDWEQLVDDDGVKSLICTKMVFSDAIVLLDGTPFDTCDVMFTQGKEAIASEAQSECSLDVIDLLQRREDQALSLWGIVGDPAIVGVYMEAMDQLVTQAITLTSAQIFDILGGMTVEGRRKNMQALKDNGSLEAWIANDKGEVWGNYLAQLDPKDLATLTDLLPEQEQTDKDVEDQAAKSENPERAKKALAELKGLQAGDANDPKRLTDGLVNLLVWGVGKAQNGTDLGKEGIIGIHHAKNAAEAMIGMPFDMYTAIFSKLVLAGGESGDRQVESVLILKAIAARKSEYLGKKTEQKQKDAHAEVDKFAEDIRGEDADKLKKATSLRDTGDSKGLQQKWTMSCGPTSIQVLHGQADPIYAKKVSETAKHTLDYDNSVGKEQKDTLGKDAVPRLVADRWKAFSGHIKAWVAADATKLPAAQALINHIQGKAANAGNLASGSAWAAGKGYTAAHIAEFKKFYPFKQPGWNADDLANKANATLVDTANSRFDKVAMPANYNAGSPTPISTMTKANATTLYNALFEGRDVAMAILWASGTGGHYMVFTDCKTTEAGGKKTRRFLLSDPWEGKSAWLTEDNVISGNVAPFGSGAIISMYL